MVRRRSNKPKAVMARDRQFWSWAKISLPRDQKDDLISRLMDRLYAEGLLNMDMRPARVQAQVDETIARQIQLMPAAFRALHARRGAEMQRRLRLMVTARKRHYLAAKRGSPRRGGISQRGQASGRGRRWAAQQQQQQEQQEPQQQESQSQDEQMEDEQVGDEQMEEEQEFLYTGSAPCSDISPVTSEDEDAPPREPLSPIYYSSTPEEPGPMDVDLSAPAMETPRRALGEPEFEILLPSPPNYYTPRSPVDSNAPDVLRASPASPASPPPEEETAGPSIITDEIQSTQPENLRVEVRSALRSGQLLEPYEPNHVGSPAPGPGTSRRQEDEISEVSTEPYTPPEDSMRKDLHPDEDYDDISAETSGEEVPGASQIEETPRETGQSSGDLALEHPEEHLEEEDSEEEHSDEEHPEEEHPEEERHEEEQRQEAQPQHPLPQQPSEDDLPDDLPDYTSDDYEAEQQQRNPVTPQSQGQAGQVPSSSYSQEQFTQYRQSGYRSPSSGSTTEKDTTSEDSDDDRPSAHAPSARSALLGPGAVLRDATIGTYDSFLEYPQDDEPQANVPSSAPALPGPSTVLHDATIATYNSSFEDPHTDRTPARAPSTSSQLDDMNSFHDATITVYAPENNSEENTQFYISQIASPVPDPETRVPIENIRFDMFQGMLRPLNYDPERHEIYWKSTSNEEVVRTGSGVVAAMLVMNLRNLQRRFFLREKRS